MQAPVICTCIKNENQASKRPSLALRSHEDKRKQNRYANDADRGHEGGPDEQDWDWQEADGEGEESRRRIQRPSKVREEK